MSMGLMKAIMGIAIGAAAGFGLDTLLHTEPMLSIGGIAVGWLASATGQRRRQTAGADGGSGGEVGWFSWGGDAGSDCGSGSDGGSCGGDGGGGGD